MIKLRFAVCILLCALLFSACLEHPEQPPNPDTLMEHGERLFIEMCAECHQSDGGGYTNLYPRFAGSPLITLHDPEPIITIVLYGQGSMPPFNGKLNTDDISAILTYIRNSWGNSAAPVSPRQSH